MAHHLHAPEAGFGRGLSWITGVDDPDTGIALGVLVLPTAGGWSEVVPSETALLLMSGELVAHVGDAGVRLQRRSVFDDLPSAVHAPCGALQSSSSAPTPPRHPPFRSHGIAAALGGAPAHVLGGSGHITALEAPAAVVELLLPFIGSCTR